MKTMKKILLSLAIISFSFAQSANIEKHEKPKVEVFEKATELGLKNACVKQNAIDHPEEAGKTAQVTVLCTTNLNQTFGVACMTVNGHLMRGSWYTDYDSGVVLYSAAPAAGGKCSCP